MNIEGISFSTSSYSGGCSASVDPEEKRIAQKLREYGFTPTGNKTTDKAILRRIEIQKAKESNCIRNDFLTVSIQEQEQIQEKKKARKKENNEQKNDFDGAKALGEQVYLSIQMKKKKKSNLSIEL